MSGRKQMSERSGSGCGRKTGMGGWVKQDGSAWMENEKNESNLSGL